MPGTTSLCQPTIMRDHLSGQPPARVVIVTWRPLYGSRAQLA